MKKSKLLLVSMILGTFYVAVLIIGLIGLAMDSSNEYALAGTAIATVIIYPHIVSTFFAVLFNILAFFTSSRGLALTAGILYAVALILFPLYFIFVIIQSVLCFIAFAKLKPQINS